MIQPTQHSRYRVMSCGIWALDVDMYNVCPSIWNVFHDGTSAPTNVIIRPVTASTPYYVNASLVGRSVPTTILTHLSSPQNAGTTDLPHHFVSFV